MKKEFGGKDKESQIRGVYQGDVARTITGSGESQLTVALAECRAGDEAEADVAMCAGVGRMRCVHVKEGWAGMRRKAKVEFGKVAQHVTLVSTRTSLHKIMMCTRYLCLLC